MPRYEFTQLLNQSLIVGLKIFVIVDAFVFEQTLSKVYEASSVRSWKRFWCASLGQDHFPYCSCNLWMDRDMNLLDQILLNQILLQELLHAQQLYFYQHYRNNRLKQWNYREDTKNGFLGWEPKHITDLHDIDEGFTCNPYDHKQDQVSYDQTSWHLCGVSVWVPGQNLGCWYTE